MNKIQVVLLAVLCLAGCSAPPGDEAGGEKEMPVAEVTATLLDSTSRWLDAKSTTGGNSDEQFYFDLSAEQFETLKNELPLTLEKLGRENHGYDLFENRGTELSPALSTFTFKMGVGSQFHYIIQGTRAELPETSPNTIVTVSRTKEGEQG